ncbi:unnamed protein product [Vitrella brassicaformis CCMP3155]|uniref:TauD/TfdA-like domain-containing protein n=1 Tax=Vitrella brassicaformis (strain CCMP3155) TaxID=1169540 RepID=A0A0G4EHY3_VITBC|nr:unnamed protein product [Vitrella brassicaformis CCMP3155]|mmetsp:Transcript_43361/g.122847  ORF Transcript_43361/g.122847 Transcript_43361/m.122847 type:complete len:295 (+) Transcript_43361:618-1502(+)|eukprot:CEL95582.1 unnamed protein product [Vitrella brassicaformis CCMP3155]
MLLDRYPGNAPRNRITKHVWTSTELPHYLPIAAHAELAETPALRPDCIIFFCERACAWGGETPIARLSLVWKDLPLWLQAKLERKGGFTAVRRGDAESKRVFDARSLGRKTKTWRDTFDTDGDPQKVEDACKQDKVELEWVDGKRGGDCLLKNTFPATTLVPAASGGGDEETALGGFFPFLHPFGNVCDAFFLASHTWRLRDIAVLLVLLCMWVLQVVVLRFFPMQCLLWATYADGSEIGLLDLFLIVRAYWRNYVMFAWREGDILFVDNLACAHARKPFDPPRRILTTVGTCR